MFGDTVRDHRRRMGLSQEELAALTGVSVRGIRDLETGRRSRPRPMTVRILADAFALHGSDRERFFRSAAGEADQAGSRPSVLPIPAQLPVDVSGFSGRVDHLQRLDALLDTSWPMVVAVTGTAGVGKTSLAVHWAHRVAQRFPDGQLYVNLRGFGASGSLVRPAEAVRSFLDALGMPPERVPHGVEAQAALYRSMLAGKRVLVLLDNALDADHVRLLLPGSPGNLALITSRNKLMSLVAVEAAQPLALEPLSGEEARGLLGGRLGMGRLTAEPRAVEQIIERSERLPLALAIIAAQAAVHPSLPLSALAQQLREARLDAFKADDALTDVRAVFFWSYRVLDPATARLFRLLGLHAGPDISVEAAASLADETLTRSRKLLAALTQSHLVFEPRPGRYLLHDLLREYAAELAHAHDTQADRHAAVQRVLHHYLQSACHASLTLDPHRHMIFALPSTLGVSPERPRDHAQAMAWFKREQPVLMAAVRQAAQSHFDTETSQLAWAIRTFLDRRGHWDDIVSTTSAALEASRRRAEPLDQAHAHNALAHAFMQLNHFPEAHTHYRSAVTLFRELDDHVGHALAHRGLAMLLSRQGRHADALEHGHQSLDLFRTAGHQVGMASALNAIGWYHARLGTHQQALTCCEQALAVLRDLGDRATTSDVLDSLGYIHLQLGDHKQAFACLRSALALRRELGIRYREASTLIRLGDTHDAAGDRAAALDAWQQAVDILTDLNHPDAEAARAKLLPLTA